MPTQKYFMKKDDKINNLTMISDPYKKSFTYKNGKTINKTYSLFKCDCGNIKEIRLENVANGKTFSCGCLNISLITARVRKGTILENGLKTCAKCKQIKPEEQFYKSAKMIDGLDCWCIDCCKDKMMRHKYHINKEEYDLMYQQQNGKCKCCGGDLTCKSKGPNIDHSHKTNKVRGLLCHNCNVGIGHFQDDINILEKAILYLKQNDLQLEYSI